MNLKNKITNISYTFIEKYFGNILNNNQLRVATIHHIDQKEFLELEKLILDLKNNGWKFITPNEFFFLKEECKNISGKNVLLTFDDGYQSQYDFTKLVLDKYKIKAIFFVINEFIFIKDEEKENFLQNKLFPGIKNINFSKFNNIQLDQLKNLINEDHVIGAHTKSHVKLSNVQDENILKEEIIYAADELESKLNFKIKNFAYTFGNFNSIDRLSIKLASKRFDYIYSGIRGNNINKNKIIAREAINYFSDLKLNRAILNGFYDFIYKSNLKKLNSWI